MRLQVELNGEHVIIASGEVHLQVCLKDLRDRFAKVPFEQSAPIVQFRETVAGSGSSIKKSTSCGGAVLEVRAVPLPACITRYLEENETVVRAIVESIDAAGAERMITTFRDGILGELEANDVEQSAVPWLQNLDRIWAFGPNRCGSNMLLNCIDGYSCSRGPFYQHGTADSQSAVPGLSFLENALITGFSLAALAGPLCEETLTGVCFELHSVSFSMVTAASNNNTLVEQTPQSAESSLKGTDWQCGMCMQSNVGSASQCAVCTTPRPAQAMQQEMGEWGGALIPGAPPAAVLAQLSGTVISTMTQACRAAFSAASVRLVEPVYDCQVIATAETIGVSCEVNIEICTNMRLEHCCLTPHCCLSYRYSPDVDRRSLLRI